MGKEIWKSVVGYEGIYEVSDLGRVRTSKTKTTYSKIHGVRHWKQRILKPKVCKRGDSRVSLWKDGREKTFLVHRLVAMAFLPNPQNKKTVNHIDGNPKNNRLENLEWATYEENNNHAFDNRLIKSAVGVILVNKNTKEIMSFRSLAKASNFLGKNAGYLSDALKRKKPIAEYEVFVRSI